MKTVIVIPVDPGEKEVVEHREADHRKQQRRMAVPRRIQEDRRAGESEPEQPRRPTYRRMARERRRLPDRRLGLKFNLDLSEL